MSQNHENYNRSKVILKKPSNMLVGYFVAMILIIFSLWPLKHDNDIIIEGFVASLLITLITIFIPSLLYPLSWALLKIGELIRSIINPTILVLLFIFAVIPSGIYLRLSGKDPMKKNFNKGLDSYWVKRYPPGPEPESLNKQF